MANDKDKITLASILKDSSYNLSLFSEKANQSFCDREQSRHLLSIAKRSIEMAIEKSEKDAQNWIDTEIKKIGGLDKARSNS